MTVECHDLLFGVVGVKQCAGMFHNDSREQQQHSPTCLPRAKNQALATSPGKHGPANDPDPQTIDAVLRSGAEGPAAPVLFINRRHQRRGAARLALHRSWLRI